MSQETDRYGKAITVQELLQILEPYNNAIAGLTSCMINISAALRNSGIEELQVEGETVFKKIDTIIEALELASTRIGSVTGSGANDERE